MNGDQIAQLTFLILLGAAIAGFYFVQNRDRIGQTLQYALIWGLLFIAVIAGATLWQDVRNTISPQVSVEDGVITIPQDRDTHYYITLEIDGTEVEFVVDTGATDTVLSREDARRLGIDVDGLNFVGQAQTANGIVRTAPVWLDDVRLGPWEDRAMRAWVTEGDLFGSLLGMSYLERFDISIGRGELRLQR